MNDHRLRVIINETPTTDYERIYKRSLQIESGCLVISAPANSEEDDIVITLNKGNYLIFVCSNSVGKDIFSYNTEYSDEMTNEEYFGAEQIAAFQNHDIFLKKTT